MLYKFEWDPIKAAANARNHHVNFEQAAAIFKDPMALTRFDSENSSDSEYGWVTLGLSGRQHYVVVVHTFKDERDDVVTIRIISARNATKREIMQYQGRQ
jgi:uncharacterized DUF497 family protein